MRILDLAYKDLSQILRDRRSLFFLVAMPIVFTFFMGFAYRGASAPQDTRLSLGWVDHDPSGVLSQQLFTWLDRSESLKLVELDEAQMPEAIRQGRIGGALVVPAGFSERSLAGEAVQLTLVADPASTTGQSLFQLLRAPVTQLISAVEIARLDVNTIASQAALSASAQPAEMLSAFQAASQAWDQTRSSDLVRVEQAVAQKASDPFGGNPYNQSSPGILVQFAVFGLVTSAQILVQERSTRTLQRLMTTAMRPWEIVAGHLLAMFALVFLQTALLVAFGQWVLKVDYLREPLATLLVVVALGLWTASMGLLIGVLAKGEDQVVLYSLIAMFVFSALGGAWFPLEGSGRLFATVGKLTPAAWAMNGLQNILIRGQGLGSAWLPVGILLGYALVFFGLAVWRFRANI